MAPRTAILLGALLAVAALAVVRADDAAPPAEAADDKQVAALFISCAG